MDKKLLIIGAGIGQVQIIKKAKEMGVHVTVATLPGNQPGIELADDVIYYDIYDRERIVEMARARQITAVISDQNDLMMPTVAYVAEKLSLPGNRFSQVMNYCNKNDFRDTCDQLGIPVPRHIAVNDENYDFSTFDAPLPWIVKPADSQSSVGVEKIDNMEMFLPALRFALSKSPTHSAIVEEFFTGKEIVCEGFIENGEYNLLAFADRKYFSLDKLMIPSQTLFPSVIRKDLLDQVVEYERRMASHVGAAFGITHSEYLVNEDTGEIRVVESALRGGGVYISSHLIPLATGIDINEVLLKKALGMETDISAVFDAREDAASAYVCFYLPEGTVISINGIKELSKMDFVKMAQIKDIAVGKQSEKLLHKGLRKGPILVAGKNRADLETKIQTVMDTLQIKVENEGKDQAGIIWH